MQNPFKRPLDSFSSITGHMYVLARSAIGKEVLSKSRLDAADRAAIWDLYAPVLQGHVNDQGFYQIVRYDTLFPYFANDEYPAARKAVKEILPKLVKNEDWRALSYFIKANPDLVEILKEAGLVSIIVKKCLERSATAQDMENDFKEDVIEIVAPEQAGTQKISMNREGWKGLGAGTWDHQLLAQEQKEAAKKPKDEAPVHNPTASSAPAGSANVVQVKFGLAQGHTSVKS